MIKFIFSFLTLLLLCQTVSTQDFYNIPLPDFETIDEDEDEEWQRFLDSVIMETLPVLEYNIPKFSIENVKMCLFRNNDFEIAHFSTKIGDMFMEEFLKFMMIYDGTKFYDIAWRVRLQGFLRDYFDRFHPIVKIAFFRLYNQDVVSKSLQAVVCDCGRDRHIEN